MKYVILLAIMLSCMAGLVALADGNNEQPLSAIKWQDATLSMLLTDYSIRSGKSIEVVEGVKMTNGVTLIWQGSVSNALSVIEGELAKQNIGLFQIESNRLVATWIDCTIVPKQPVQKRPDTKPYLERMRARRAEKLNEMESNNRKDDTGE